MYKVNLSNNYSHKYIHYLIPIHIEHFIYSKSKHINLDVCHNLTNILYKKMPIKLLLYQLMHVLTKVLNYQQSVKHKIHESYFLKELFYTEVLDIG